MYAMMEGKRYSALIGDKRKLITWSDGDVWSKNGPYDGSIIYNTY